MVVRYREKPLTLNEIIAKRMAQQGEGAERATMDKFNIPLLKLNAKGVVEHVNKKTTSSFELGREKLVGRHISEILEEEPTDHKGLFAELQQKIAEAKPGETVSLRPSLVIRTDPRGEPVESIVRFSVHRPKEGEPKVYASVSHTRRVLEQSKLLKEFFDLADNVNSQRDLDRLLQDIADDFAHRFNSAAIVVRPSGATNLELAAFAGKGILPRDFVKFNDIPIGKGLLGKAAQTLQPVEVQDISNWEESFSRDLDAKYGFKHSMAVPLTIKGSDGKPILVGVIGLFKGGEHADEKFRPHERRMLNVLAGNTATAIENARLTQDLRSLAERDIKTGLHNYVVLSQRMKDYFNAKSPGSKEFKLNLKDKRASVFFVDANNLKLLNDFHGYSEGDRGIRAIAEILKKHAPEGATVARVGGDEFVVFAPGIDMDASDKLKKKIQSEIGEETSKDNTFKQMNFGASVAFMHFGAGGESRENYKNLYEIAKPGNEEELEGGVFMRKLLNLAEERMKRLKKKREETHIYLPVLLQDLAQKAASREITPVEERAILKHVILGQAGPTVSKLYGILKRKAVKELREKK